MQPSAFAARKSTPPSSISPSHSEAGRLRDALDLVRTLGDGFNGAIHASVAGIEGGDACDPAIRPAALLAPKIAPAKTESAETTRDHLIRLALAGDARIEH